MINEYKQTPVNSYFFIKLKDKTVSIKLHKRLQMKEIVRLRLMKKHPIMFNELQDFLYQMKAFTAKVDNAIYCSSDYFQTLNPKWR